MWVLDPNTGRRLIVGGRKYRGWLRQQYVLAGDRLVLEVNPCRRYALNPLTNPFTHRRIQENGFTARKLQRHCANDGLPCLMWQASRFRKNPNTGRTITTGLPTWRSILHKCAANDDVCGTWSHVARKENIHPITGRQTSTKTKRKLDQCLPQTPSLLKDKEMKSISTKCGDTTKARLIGYGLAVKKSTIANAGRGLFAMQEFKRGDTITEYDGLVIDIQEAERRRSRGLASHIRSLASGRVAIDGKNVPSYWGHGGGSFINDPRSLNRVNAKFCNTNRILKGLARRGLHVLERTFVRATKDIQKGEEIFASYGKGYWKNNH